MDVRLSANVVLAWDYNAAAEFNMALVQFVVRS